MSTTAATARYVIAADDKTKAAIASINAGFKNMDRGIKSAVRGINTSLGLIAGYGLQRAFRSVFTETAKQSKEFALALDEVKFAAKDLLSSEDGAPAMTAAMRELAETLKDPELKQAVDDLTSTLIRLGAATAEGAAHTFVGWKVLLGATGDEVENLRRQIDALDASMEQARVAGQKSGIDPTAEIARLQAQRDALSRQQMSAIDRGPTPRATSLGFDTSLSGLPGFEVGDLNIASDLMKDMAQFQRLANINPVDDLQEKLGEFVKTFESDINSGVIDTAQHAADSISEIGDKLGEDIIGKAADLSVFGEQAARDMQSAFADFLFDPFDDGVKGMLKSFVDTLRRMTAEVAAAQIFDQFGIAKLLGGNVGKGGGGVPLSAFLDAFSVPAYASGTGFVPQDQLALVHKGEAIIPANLNRGVGGVGGVSIVNNIDARGSTPDTIKALPEILKRNNEVLKAQIVEGIRRGKYRIFG